MRIYKIFNSESSTLNLGLKEFYFIRICRFLFKADRRFKLCLISNDLYYQTFELALKEVQTLTCFQNFKNLEAILSHFWYQFKSRFSANFDLPLLQLHEKPF